MNSLTTNTIFSQKGFTLLELMIVLMLVGILIGAASLAVGTNPTKEMENETLRLLALTRLANETSILNNKEIGIKFEKNGYSFLSYDVLSEKWAPLSDQVLKRHILPDTIAVKFEIDGDEYEKEGLNLSQISIGLDDIGINLDEVGIDLGGDGLKKVEPDVIFYSDGSYDAFRIWFTFSDDFLETQQWDDETSRYQLRTDGFAEPIFEVVEDDDF